MSDASNDRLFEILPGGWAHFSYGNIHARDISYVCDPLFDIAEAVIGVLEDGKSSVVRFDHEGDFSEIVVSDFGLVHIRDGKCDFSPMRHGDMLLLASRLMREVEQDKLAWADAWGNQGNREEYLDYVEETIDELREAIRIVAARDERPLNYQRKTFRDRELFGVPDKFLL